MNFEVLDTTGFHLTVRLNDNRKTPVRAARLVQSRECVDNREMPRFFSHVQVGDFMSNWRLIALVASLSVTGISTAQASGAPTERETFIAASALLSTSIGAPITVVGAIIYGVVTTTRGGSGSDVAAEIYLREHAIQLAMDLTMGDGPVLRDLAAAAEIQADDYALFASRVRAERRSLLALSEVAHLTPERATLFMNRLGDLIKSDETLARNYRAYLTRHGDKG